jgi:hypothetical protein
MKKLTKAAAGLAGIMALALTAAPATLRAGAHDNAVREAQPVLTELGAGASALTFWVSAPDGWHVVTTVDSVSGRDGGAETHAVVRFSSVLLPGQSQLISVPVGAGEQQQVLRIRRLDDGLDVTRVAASSV